MRVLLYSRHRDEILPALQRRDVNLVTDNPDVVVTYGGDGTLLGAERDWPSVPKVPIRRSRGWVKCDRHREDTILENMESGSLCRRRLLKLEGVAKVRTIVGLNDITLHHARVSTAVRYRVLINGEPYSGEIIGDGLVVATPFGSGAYYRSITHSIFEVGIGLAFNNSTELVNHLVLSEESRVDIEITRGPALLVADNSLDPVELERGDRAAVCRHLHPAIVLGIGALHCGDCRRVAS